MNMRVQKNTGFLFFMFVALGVFTIPSFSHAQSVKSLTEDNIKSFVNKTADLTSGKKLEMSSDEIGDYFEEHLHEHARFKSVLKYDIPGFPPQEASMSLDKEEFIDNVKSGAQALSDYKNKIRIKDIKISSDKRKATVQTTGSESGIMPVSSDGKTKQHIPVEGASTCQQILMLEKGTIQMYSANCETKIKFSSEFN